MSRRSSARRHHPFVLLALLLAALISLQVVLRVWPLLLAGGAVWLGWRWWHRNPLPQVDRNARPPLIQGQVMNEICMHGVPYPCGICDGASSVVDAAELARLRSDNAKLRTKVRVLSDMLNGPETRQ